MVSIGEIEVSSWHTSCELTVETVIPWGRFARIREDIEKGAKSAEEGGNGLGKIWYEWCMEQVAPFMQ